MQNSKTGWVTIFTAFKSNSILLIMLNGNSDNKKGSYEPYFILTVNVCDDVVIERAVLDFALQL